MLVLEKIWRVHAMPSSSAIGVPQAEATPDRASLLLRSHSRRTAHRIPLARTTRIAFALSYIGRLEVVVFDHADLVLIAHLSA